jgi:hypothetical protein
MSVHAPVGQTAMKPHDCGCGCDSRCCDLDCLVRPNFYCGQMLTDADMTALVDWTRRRLSLSRYRDGWGVVCGLQVTCAPPGTRAGCCDDGDGPHVYVNPGYAVDCCGNDLVVCEPLPVDLSHVCRPDDDPCAPLTATTEQGRPAAGTRGRQGTGATDCWDHLKDGVFAVDLYLRYDEDLGQGQRPLLGSRCGPDAGCEYARVFERPCVHAEPVALPTGQTPADEPEAADKARLDAVVKEIAEALKKGARGVRDYIRRHPPARFCFLDDLLCCLIDAEKTSTRKTIEAMLVRLRFWLFYDWFLQQLECDCGSCRPDTGVPLARLYLRRTGDVQPACRVLYIDYSAPYRRPIARDECAPPPRPDLFDLRRYYWLTREQAAQVLEHQGIAMATTAITEDVAYDHLSAGLRFAARAKPALQAQFVRDPSGVDRVAAFSYTP